MNFPHVKCHIELLNKLFVTDITLCLVRFTVYFTVSYKMSFPSELLSTNCTLILFHRIMNFFMAFQMITFNKTFTTCLTTVWPYI